MTYHDDGGASTQRVTGEKVYFRAPAMHTTSVRRPPVTTSQEMVEVEVGKSRKLKRSQLLLVWLECDGTAEHGGWKVRRCSMCAGIAQPSGTPTWCWRSRSVRPAGAEMRWTPQARWWWLMARGIGETCRIGWMKAGLSAHASDADEGLELTEARRCFWKCDLQKGGALVFVS